MTKLAKTAAAVDFSAARGSSTSAVGVNCESDGGARAETSRGPRSLHNALAARASAPAPDLESISSHGPQCNASSEFGLCMRPKSTTSCRGSTSSPHP
eukprot:491234-Pleurochrysis_carterae.AAC.1